MLGNLDIFMKNKGNRALVFIIYINSLNKLFRVIRVFWKI